MESEIKCGMCNVQAFNQIHEWLGHVRLFHRGRKEFRQMCPFQNCSGVFIQFSSLRSHLYRKHQFSVYSISGTDNYANTAADSDQLSAPDEPSASAAGSSRPSPCLTEQAMINSTSEKDAQIKVTASSQLQEQSLLLSREIFSAVMNFEESSCLTQVDVTKLVGLMSHVSKAQLDFVKEYMASYFNIDFQGPEEKRKWNILLSLLEGPYSNISEPRRMLRKAITEFGLVMPVQYKLPQSIDERFTGKRERTFVFISLIKQVELMLQNDALYQTLTSRSGTCACCGTEFMVDICDGERFRSLPPMNEDGIHIFLILYYDDLEACNPLGSKNKKHKLGMFYFCMANLDPKSRSSLKAINLACVAKSEDIKRDSMDKILEPLVEELNMLADGVDITVKGDARKLYARVCAIVADNLGSHALAGFKEGFTAQRPCRVCMTLFESMHDRHRNRQFKLRNKEDHCKQCKDLSDASGDKKLVQHYSSMYGINRDSSLNSIKGLHVTDGCMCPDIMHDLLLGVLPLQLKLMLSYFVKKRFFSLDQLNQAIEHFRYGPSEVKNKPSSIDQTALTKKGHLRQSASQCWLLSTILPLLIGHFIPQRNGVWQSYCLLLKICRICFAREVSPDMLSVLEGIIEDYLVLYRLHLRSSLIPKQHNLVHYPHLMRRLGPLSNLWAMRFEAKNGWIKKVARIVGSYKNLPWTVALKQQKLQALFVHDFGKESNTRGMKKRGDVLLKNVAWGAQLCCLIGRDSLDISVEEFGSLSVRSQVYSQRAGYILAYGSNGLPQFGLLCNIYIFGDEVYFNLEMRRTLKFSNHYQAYRVAEKGTNPNSAESPHYCVVRYDDLRDTTLYHVHCKNLGLTPRENVYRPSPISDYIIMKASVPGLAEN